MITFDEINEYDPNEFRIYTKESEPYYCPVCGTKLRWESDFMRDEILCIEEGQMDDDDNGVVGTWNCPQCDRTYEV